MMSERFKRVLGAVTMALLLLFLATPLFASEAELAIPVLSSAQNNLLMIGFLVCFGGIVFGYLEYVKSKEIT